MQNGKSMSEAVKEFKTNEISEAKKDFEKEVAKVSDIVKKIKSQFKITVIRDNVATSIKDEEEPTVVIKGSEDEISNVGAFLKKNRFVQHPEKDFSKADGLAFRPYNKFVKDFTKDKLKAGEDSLEITNAY